MSHDFPRSDFEQNGVHVLSPDEADVLIRDLERIADLRAAGCICTPGRLGGGPATHAEDVSCTVHNSA